MILKNNSAIEIVYVLHWWLNEQCPVTSLPLGDSTSSGPRGKSPKSAHLLTYSQASTQASTLNRPRHRFSSHADRARPNVPVLRPQQLLRRSRRIPRRLARSSAVRCRGGAQVPSVSRELETATTAVVGRPLRISEVLVTSSSGPNNASQATHRARLGLLWRLLSD